MEQLPEAAHATYPPSSLGSLERCPGFKNRSGDKTPSSLKGDRIHAALEKDTTESLDQDERAIAQMCKDYIDGVIAEHRPALPDKDIRERKGKIVMDLGAGIKDFGTPDRLLIYGDFGEMFDYKSGYREVPDPEQNAQAWAYVLGALQKYPQLSAIKFTILVPNRDDVLFHEFTRADVPRMKLRLNTIIRRAMEIDWSHIEDFVERLNPGPELCEYCEHQTTCPALAAKHLSVAAVVGEGLPVPKSLIVSKKRLDDIPKILRLAPLLEAWAKEARAEALRLNLQEGVDIPGFKRQNRKTDRAVSSVPGAWEAVKEKINLKQFLAACATVSLPKLEEFFKAVAPKGQKSKADRDLECKLRDAGVWIEQGEIYYLKERKK